MLTAALLVLGFLGQSPGDAEAVREQVRKLGDDDQKVRDAAQLRLKGLGPLALPELDKAAKDPDAELAARASWLGRWIRLHETLSPRVRQAVPDIEDRVLSDQEGECAAVFLELTRTENGKKAFPDLSAEDLSPVARAALVERGASSDKQKVCKEIVLRDISGAAPALLSLLSSPSEQCRYQAAWALGWVGGPGAVKPLLAVLKDPGEQPRMAAAVALGRLGARESRDALKEMLQDPHPGIRQAALLGLEDLGDPSVAPDLLPFIKDDDRDVRWAASDALSNLDNGAVIEPLLAILADHYNEAYRLAAAEALLGLHRKEAARGFVKATEDRSPRVREVALRALGELGDPESAPKLRSVLADPRNPDRAAAATAIGLLGQKSLAQDLIGCLQDPSYKVRKAAADALGELGAPEAVPALAKLLREDLDIEVGVAASSALCRLGSTLGLAKSLASLERLADLNAVRAPEAWAALSALKLKADVVGTTRQILEQLAASASMPLRISPGVPLTAAIRRVHCQGGRASLIDALKQACPGGVTFIVERGQITILLRDEAKGLWKAWGESVLPKER